MFNLRLAPGGRGIELLRMLPAMFAGAVLTLPGLLPALALDSGANRRTTGEAAAYYVYARLAHHLDPISLAGQSPGPVARFAALCVAWGMLWAVSRHRGGAKGLRPLCGFVNTAILLAAMGATISVLGLLDWIDYHPAARLLRFYWFRLSDVAVPLGVALAATWLAVEAYERGHSPSCRVGASERAPPERGFPGTWWAPLRSAHPTRFGAACLAALALAAAVHLATHLWEQKQSIPALLDQGQYHAAWLDACNFVRSLARHCPDGPVLHAAHIIHFQVVHRPAGGGQP